MAPASHHQALIGLAATVLFSIQMPDRAHANGGLGGVGAFAPLDSRGQGGAVSVTNTNTNGQAGGGSGGGGSGAGDGGSGGGGGGTSGGTVSPGFGQGGSGGAGSNGAAGGAGATNSSTPGGAGADGATFGDGGGGGGGGSGLFSAGSASFIIPGTFTASAGGPGGNGNGTGGNPGSNGTGGGGGGGNGGVGIILGTTAGSTLTVGTGVTINGGQGGAGGAGPGLAGGGNGGTGGIGALLGPGTTLINSGAINGGAQGIGGTSGFPGRDGAGGSPGVGVVGQGITVFQNGGTISGLSAITFNSGGTITFNNGGATGLTGDINVGGVGAALTFAQGIGVDTIVGNVINGGSFFIKTGGDKITLTAANNRFGFTMINGGTLSISADNNLGLSDATGSFFFGGGTLNTTTTFATPRDVTIGFAPINFTATANTGAFTQTAGTALTLNGQVSGGGTLIQNGPGTLILGADNTGFTGSTSILAGTLQLGTGGTAGSIAGNIANDATLVFNRSNALTIDGVISGAGVVNQIGTGTTTLTADNTYNGATTIAAGILQLGNGGATGAVAGNIVNNAALVINRTGALALNGVFTGAGSLTQNGTVTTTLGGNSPGFIGASTVNGGAMRVNGFFGNSPFTVNAGGTLGGNGTVGSTSINGGTLAPGNSIGTLNVQGGLSFTAASSYMVEISPANADLVNVTGIATLGGATVNASFAAGAYVAKQYTIVNATGAVTGTFNGPVNTNLPGGFQSSLSYDAKHAYLDLTLYAGPTFATGLNTNQSNVANALTGFFNRTGGIPMIYGALTPAGLTSASGELPTASHQATFDAMELFLGLLTDPFVAGRGEPAGTAGSAASFAEENDAAAAYASSRKQRSGSEREAYAAMHRKAPALIDAIQRWSIWGAGYGGSQTTDGNAALGSNTATSRIYGMAAGADYRISPDTVAGFALAGGGTSFSLANGLGAGRSDLFQAGGFIRYTVGSAYFTGALAYGWQDIVTDRTVPVAGDILRARFNANTYSGRAESGYRFVAPWLNVGLTPYAAGQFVTYGLPAYAERALAGPGAFALNYAASDVTASRSELGLRGDKTFASGDGVLTLRGRGAWAHNFNTDRSIAATFQALPGASFVVNGARQARDAALVTGSAEMKWRTGWSAAATFEGGFSNVTTSYAGKGVVRYAW